MKTLKKILSRPEFKNSPITLLDIGASECIHKKWKVIAKYSVCIAFDADKRDFSFSVNTTKEYKKLIVYNTVVTEFPKKTTNFYLTKSPYCSSILKPDNSSLQEWAFAEKFIIEKTEQITSITLNEVLKEQKIDKIDWFKSDSQGTDLRLFKSLGKEKYKNILVAEMEPGIIDSYYEEDKMTKVLEFMSDNDFFLSEINIKGSQRIAQNILEQITKSRTTQKLIQFSHKTSPGWAELTFLNSKVTEMNLREHLLGWIFAILLKQHGFAVLIARKGQSKFEDEIFKEMERYALKKIKHNAFKLKFVPSIIEKIKKI
jgi:hypothetical protein